MSADFEHRITLFVVKLPTLSVKTDIIYQLKEVESLYRSPVAQKHPKPNIVSLTFHHSSLTDSNNVRYASNLPRAHAFCVLHKSFPLDVAVLKDFLNILNYFSSKTVRTVKQTNKQYSYPLRQNNL